jgi:hypothetical protein
MSTTARTTSADHTPGRGKSAGGLSDTHFAALFGGGRPSFVPPTIADRQCGNPASGTYLSLHVADGSDSRPCATHADSPTQ